MNTRTLIINLWAIAVLATAAICATVAVSVRNAEMMNAKREALHRASEKERQTAGSMGSPGLRAIQAAEDEFNRQERLFR